MKNKDADVSELTFDEFGRGYNRVTQTSDADRRALTDLETTRDRLQSELAQLKQGVRGLVGALQAIAEPSLADERDCLGADWNAAEEIARAGLASFHAKYPTI